MDVSNQLKKFLKWASFSLSGHLVLFELACGLPLTSAFLFLSYRDGTLTSQIAIQVVLIGLAAGAISGSFVWYPISRPLIERRKQ